MNELLQGGYFLCASLYFFFKKTMAKISFVLFKDNYWLFMYTYCRDKMNRLFILTYFIFIKIIIF